MPRDYLNVKEMDINPCGILLVKSDSKGHRLLFRFPFTNSKERNTNKKFIRNTPYSLQIMEDTLYNCCVVKNTEGGLNDFSDELLSTLFAVKSKFCGHKFELKVNNIRFVGHPACIELNSKSNAHNKTEAPSSILIHIVFAMKAAADYSVIKSYYELSKRLGIAIRHEEKRCGYFSKEMKKMMAAHDLPDELDDQQSSFDVILAQCSLARDMKFIYESLCSKGTVNFRLNNWIEVSFCLTQKVHAVHIPNFTIGPEDIDKCLQNLKPYHGILLLDDILALLNSLPPDTSPSLIRFLKVYSPLKNLQMISADSDLTIAQVYNLIGHLLNWGCAMVIYPLSETNIYVIAPGAVISGHSRLREKFAEQFPGHNLLELMHEFSLPSTMLHKLNPLTHSEEQAILVQMVAWMLRHRLIMQLHTYIYFMPTKKGIMQVEDVAVTSRSRHQSGNTNFDQNNSEVDANSVKEPSDSDISSLISEDFAKIPMTTFQTELNSWLNISLVDEGDKIEEFVIEADFISNLSEDERKALLKLPGTSNPEDFHLLLRLLKQGYLQGTSHLEEIMYLENIRRSQLVQLIEKFSDILITCEYEDPAVSMFYPAVQ